MSRGRPYPPFSMAGRGYEQVGAAFEEERRALIEEIRIKDALLKEEKKDG